MDYNNRYQLTSYNAIYWINHYPVGSVVSFVNISPLDRDFIRWIASFSLWTTGDWTLGSCLEAPQQWCWGTRPLMSLFVNFFQCDWPKQYQETDSKLKEKTGGWPNIEIADWLLDHRAGFKPNNRNHSSDINDNNAPVLLFDSIINT